MDSLLEHIQEEVRAGRPASAAVARRLCEIVFVEALRALMETSPDATSALTALADPNIGRALEAVHEHPEGDWSLERLAATSGLSRTVLIERFRGRLGVSPMRYLARWRLQKAHALLADPRLIIAEIAQAVGYGSDAALNRAFKEHFGQPPGKAREGRHEPSFLG